MLAPGSLGSVRDACVAMQNASRVEDGCIDYTFSVDLGNEDVMRISERWASLDALKAHFVMPHMAEFQKTLAAHPPVSSDVHFFEVDEIDRPQI